LNRTTNFRANARHQSTDAIYGSKTLIKKERIILGMMLVRRRRSIRQHPITNEVLHQLKRPRRVSNVNNLVILPINAPKTEVIESAIIVVRGVTMLINAPTIKPKKRREYIQKIDDKYDIDLKDYYVEDWFTKDGSHD
jgi:hypothetical protein